MVHLGDPVDGSGLDLRVGEIAGDHVGDAELTQAGCGGIRLHDGAQRHAAAEELGDEQASLVPRRGGDEGEAHAPAHAFAKASCAS